MMNTRAIEIDAAVKVVTTVDFSFEWWWGHRQLMEKSPEYAMATAREVLQLPAGVQPHCSPLLTLKTTRKGRAKELFSRYFLVWDTAASEQAGKQPLMLEVIARLTGIMVVASVGGVRCRLTGGHGPDAFVTVTYGETSFSASVTSEDTGALWRPKHDHIPQRELEAAFEAAIVAFDAAQEQVEDRLQVEPFGPQTARVRY